MAKNPWFPLYVSDYLSKTTGLTAELHGAYLLLLMAYWARGGALPDDDGQLSEMARITGKRWAAARKVLEQFFTIGDGLWRNKRMDEELTEAEQRFERRSNAGRKNRQSLTNDRPMVDQQTHQRPTHPHPQSQVRINTRFVKGGAKQFAGIGEPEKREKRPEKADADMAAHLTKFCGMDNGTAWQTVMAARDPGDEKHTEAARLCEKQSREHRLGWFHMEAAE